MNKLDEDLTGQELAEKRLVDLLNAVTDTRSKIEALARLCREGRHNAQALWMKTRAEELKAAMDAALAAPYTGKSGYESYRSQVEAESARQEDPNFCPKCGNILPPGAGCKRIDGCPRIVTMEYGQIDWSALRDACTDEPTEDDTRMVADMMANIRASDTFAGKEYRDLVRMAQEDIKYGH